MGRDVGVRAPKRQFPLATPGAALAVGAATVALLVCLAVVSSAEHQFKLSGLAQVALIVSFAVVGVIVAWHQPRNPMGWVLIGVTFFFFLADAGRLVMPSSTIGCTAVGCRWAGWPCC